MNMNTKVGATKEEITLQQFVRLEALTLIKNNEKLELKSEKENQKTLQLDYYWFTFQTKTCCSHPLR